MHNFKSLVNKIVPLSEADDFETARREWSLVKVNLSTYYDRCACGHRIKRICYMKNDMNGNKIKVGSVCVEKFIGVNTKKIFDSLARLIEGKTKHPAPELRNFCKESGIISGDDAFFLETIFKRRILSVTSAMRREELLGVIAMNMFKMKHHE